MGKWREIFWKNSTNCLGI